jgi:hypothetical protein
MIILVLGPALLNDARHVSSPALPKKSPRTVVVADDDAADAVEDRIAQT